jgi:hypothetical protein
MSESTGTRRARAFLPCLSAAFLLVASCGAQDVAGFAWKDTSGASLPFAQASAWPSGEEGAFAPGRSANRYIPARAITAPGDSSLVVQVRRASSETARLSLALSAKPDGSSALVRASFPILAERVSLCLPFVEDSRIACLVVAAEAGSGAFSIESIAFQPAFRGIAVEPKGLRVSAGFSLVKTEGSQVLTIDNPFASKSGTNRRGLVLEYGPESTAAILRLAAREPDGREVGFALRTHPEGIRTAIDLGTLPGDAVSLALRAPEGLEIKAFYAAELPSDDFELADLGRVLLAAPPEADYEAYRWDLRPSVLVFDFKDYDTQSLYLRRLAFFVEKIGFRGRLAKDEEIASLHDWNAHDYRPEDLAAFFQAARDKSFPLNSREREMEGVLLRGGVIEEVGGKLTAGKGAIISISRESSQALRWTFAVHESTHAIFFSDPDYRDFARSLWASLDAGEKWFWKVYFGWKTYDVNSDYLMGNEFQAYLLQQPVAAAEEYFTKRKVDELLEKHPELTEKVEAYMATYGKSFASRAKQLEDWLGRKYGIDAGRTVFLTRR